MPHVSHRGFTLIELSIVLIVAALIIGGILVGQTLKRSAELQSLVTDEAKYVEAARQFKEKYGYLPGDLPTATNYWGTDPNGCPNSGPFYTTPQTKTCNGNGDGFINSDGSGTSSPYLMFETWRAWQQLADAGFVEGQFSGTPGTYCFTEGAPGLNEPTTKMTGGAYEWNYYLPANALAATHGGLVYTGMSFYTQYLLIGATTTTSCGSNILPIMTPAEALSLDSKLDDGMPTTGKWIAGDAPGECITPEGGTGATYNTTAVQPYFTTTFKANQIVCSFAAEVDW